MGTKILPLKSNKIVLELKLYFRYCKRTKDGIYLHAFYQIQKILDKFSALFPVETSVWELDSEDGYRCGML